MNNCLEHKSQVCGSGTFIVQTSYFTITMELCKFLCAVFSISIVLIKLLPETSTASTEGKFQQHTVFSYSTVNVTGDGPASVMQLTIATAPDGKYHYVRKENGNTTTGIWDGPLPSTPDADKIAQEITSNLKLTSELNVLSTEINSSIQEYVNKAFFI